MTDQLDLSKLAPPQPKHRQPEYFNLFLAQMSMQFSDSIAQWNHDSRKIFDKDYHAITGTENGEPAKQKVMRLAAYKAGYTYWAYKSNFVCLHKETFVPGSYFRGAKTVVDNDLTKGRGHDLNVTWAGGKIKGVGQVTFLSSHYPLYAKPYKKDPAQKVNVKHARALAQEIGNLAERFGKGNALVFYGGDQNMVDSKSDTFYGEDLTSVWDELGKYENTGHGNIDVIASYDHDGRVEARSIRALDDKEQFMHMDHFPVEARFKIRKLAA